MHLEGAVLVVLLMLCSTCNAIPTRHHLNQAGSASASASASNGVYHRTGYHFQPIKNWMNDPNGPMFYKGYYHLFYQYNPYSAVWGNITWGHAISKDMLRWSYLDLALVPDQWYDIYGVWSGSATIVDGKPVLLYTGWCNASNTLKVQMQSIAIPENPNDPFLRKWKKHPQNPFAVAPAGINNTDFRDPTTGWLGSDGVWRILLGSKHNQGHSGIALLYKSSDFVSWELVANPLYSGPGTGMWECPDFYPVAIHGNSGLDTSANGVSVKHVLKVSLDDKRYDCYVVGTYNEKSDTFRPHVETNDAITMLRYDYGVFYASKTYYDDNKGRRILWGWISETDTSADDLAKGWSSVQGIPRSIWLDEENMNMLKQWPIEEVEALRTKNIVQNNVLLTPGKTIEIKGGNGPMIDVEVAFDIGEKHKFGGLNFDVDEAKAICNQTTHKGILASFGLHVLASHDLRERTSIYFRLVHFKDGVHSVVCSDQRRSSLTATNVTKTLYGSFVTATKGKDLSMRVLVDHSLVETFAQGGKACITSRAYPSIAIKNNANLFLFNDGKSTIKATNISVWQLGKLTFNSL